MRKKITQGLVNKLKTPDSRIEIRDTDLKGFLLRCAPSGRKTYEVEYRRSDGKRTRYKLGTSDALTAAQAKDAAKEFLANLALGEDLGEVRRKAKANRLESYLRETYGPWVVENRRAGAHTLRRLLSAFEPLLNHRLHDLTPWALEKWRNEKRKKRGVRAVTINRDIAVLKAALNCAVEWGILEENPIKGLKPLPERDSQVKVRYLSLEEEGALLAALEAREERIRVDRDSANAWREERGYEPYQDLRKASFVDHLKPMVLVSLNTGLRRGELFHLEWADVDLDRAMLTVRVDTAKSGKMRHIPLNGRTQEVLKQWKQIYPGGPLVFPNKEGKPFNNVTKAWSNLLEEASIYDFRWHDMRHDFASKLIMSGVDLNTVRELLGHSDLKMTLRYAHLAPEHKRAAVEKLGKHRPTTNKLMQSL